MAKKYFLPNDKIYQIIDIHYGSIEDGNIGCCANCGRVITNITTIKDELNKHYQVGLDCASTLASIKEEELNNALYIFGIGKKIRQAVLNKIRYSTIGKFELIKKENNTNIVFNSTPRNRYTTQVSNSDNANKVILPQLKNLEGYHLKGKLITEDLYNKLCKLIVVGDQTKGSYNQTVMSIDLDNNKIIVENTYIGTSLRTKTIFDVLEELIYTDKFDEFIREYNG